MKSRLSGVMALGMMALGVAWPGSASAQSRGAALLFRHSNGDLSALAVKGTAPLITDRSPEATLFPIYRVTTDWAVIGAGDFNNDGHGDIIWRHWSNQLSVWAMAGTNVKNYNQPGATAPALPNEPAKPFLGDLNADGIVDVVWTGKRARRPPIDGGGGLGDPSQSNWDYLTDIWTMQAGTAAPASRQTLVSSTEFTAAVGQFGGTASADRFVRTFQGNTAFVLTGGSRVNSHYVPFEWEVKGTGDFDNDGNSDLLWHNRNDGQVAIWLIENGATKAMAVIGGVSMSEWNIQGVGDMDGDSRSDIIWRNTNGLTSVWLVNGLTVVNNGAPGFWLPLDWQFAGVMPTRTRLGAFHGGAFTIARSQPCVPQLFTIAGPVPEMHSREFGAIPSSVQEWTGETRCTHTLTSPYVNIAGMYDITTSSLGKVMIGIMPDGVDKTIHCPSGAKCTVTPPQPQPPPQPTTVLHDLKIWNGIPNYIPAIGEPIWYSARFPVFASSNAKLVNVRALRRMFLLKAGQNQLACFDAQKRFLLNSGQSLGDSGMTFIFGSSRPSLPQQITACATEVNNPVPQTYRVEVTSQAN